MFCMFFCDKALPARSRCRHDHQPGPTDRQAVGTIHGAQCAPRAPYFLELLS